MYKKLFEEAEDINYKNTENSKKETDPNKSDRNKIGFDLVNDIENVSPSMLEKSAENQLKSSLFVNYHNQLENEIPPNWAFAEKHALAKRVAPEKPSHDLIEKDICACCGLEVDREEIGAFPSCKIF